MRGICGAKVCATYGNDGEHTKIGVDYDHRNLIRGGSAIGYRSTDSGGLQKEAYFFRKQCLTLREETEWLELIENDFNQICGSDKKDH